MGFRHELARRATAEQIPDYQRRLLHKRALTVLAEPPIDPNGWRRWRFTPSRPATPTPSSATAPAAAERAAALGANREAAQLYALALRHADTTPDQQKVIWLERHAFSSYL